MTRRTFHPAALLGAAVLVACTLLVALLALSGHEAQAAFPGDNGRIAFSTPVRIPGDTESQEQIFTIKPDGTGVKQLTKASPQYNVRPSYSPDGTKIAWEKFDGIWVMNADGTKKRKLASGSAPVFSADGSRVAFLGNRGIYIKALEGGASRRIIETNNNVGSLSFRPTGGRIAFGFSGALPGCTDCSGNGEIATVRTDGTGLKVITDTPGGNGAGGPDWSPDGSKLVFSVYNPATEETSIKIIRADGTGQRTVFPPRYSIRGGAVFSPDGNRVAFSYLRDIWTIHPDGTQLEQVTDTPQTYDDAPNWGPKPSTG